MIGISTPANAQEVQCGPHKNITEALKNNYQEVTAALGLTDDGKMIEVFVSPMGTWTIAIIEPDGTSCAVGSGIGWEMITEPPVWQDS